ncbi:MAG: methylenetetrahydrofolate reductase [Woeseiaceae bacterium]|nr:methylenetetrahydrofolate reductase [Woeseiaceae bacterium]
MKTFQKALRESDLVVTAEMPLFPSTRADGVRRHLDTLAPAVDAVQVAEDRMAEGRIAGLAVAALSLERGVDPVMHLSCRDRNRIGLQSEILGAATLGVTTLVIDRGDKIPPHLKGKVRGVFDTSGIQLIGMTRRLAEHLDVEAAPEFMVGTIVAVIRPKPDWEPAKITQKLDAGARFLQTLPCFNVKLLKQYLARVIERKITHRAPIIVTVPLITSVDSVESVRERYKGAALPRPKLKRIAEADDPRATGIRLCAAAIRDIRSMPGVSGVNILYDADPESVVEALAASAD